MVENKKQKVTALQVAKYFLSRDPKREYFVTGKMPKISGIAIPTIGNFRLNKLLHISQILYCAKKGEYLFDEPLMAFEHGGVVYEVYRQFHFLVKQYYNETNHLSLEIKNFLDKIYNFFHTLENDDLEEFTHNDPAWIEVWNQENNGIKEMAHEQRFIDYYQKATSRLVKKVGL